MCVMKLYSILIISFNRYMVECEYVVIKTSDKRSPVLIDTWWNVNILTPQSFGEEQLF